MNDNQGDAYVDWNLSNLEIRTRTVEKTLEPLVAHVTTLVSQGGPSKLKKGRSKRAHLLRDAVHRATENFVLKGEEIANENVEVRSEMMTAVNDVRETGNMMHTTSSEFADDPCSSLKRTAMVRAARELLSAVTRLLVLADMVDVYLLLKSLRAVEEDLGRLDQASSQVEVVDSFRCLGRQLVELADRAGRRQSDLKDLRHRDDLASARATLKKNSMMLLTTSKMYVRHPEISAAKSNRDFVIGEVYDAVHCIERVAQAAGPSDPHVYEGIGELAAALDDFDHKVIMEPSAYQTVRTRAALEERLESIISGAALMADSSCTRDERREKIVRQCNSVRQALQDVLTEYENNSGNPDPTDDLYKAIDSICKSTRDLRRQLKKAAVDHISDSFLETSVPVLILNEAARAGNQHEVEEYGQVFMEHAGKLVEVANLACSLSSNEEGVKLVRIAASQLEVLAPQVVNAARVLALRPKSKVAQENMGVFRASWESHVRVLTEAVDEITSVSDFLTVSEGHIMDDINKCLSALGDNDVDSLDRRAGAIRGRSMRLCNVVTAEMDNFGAGVYADRVKEAIDVLLNTVMPGFTERVAITTDAMTIGRRRDVDGDEFVYAVHLVRDAIKDIHRAVRMNTSMEEQQSEDESDVQDNFQATQNAELYSERASEQQLDNEYLYESRSQLLSHTRQRPSHIDTGNVRSSGTYGSYSSYSDLYNDTQSQDRHGNSDNADYQYLKYNDQYEQDDLEPLHPSQENYVDTIIPPEDLIEGKTARAWMRELPEQEKAAIQQQIAVFREEKKKLDLEIAKWDSRGNDIIMLAKQMCMIMMEMTDFTRGRGPLKTTNDVINAAKRISQIGSRLNDLCQRIADDCPDSTSKEDLAAYLGRIILCSHQLNITSKVKADIQNVEGELIISGLDSATSLIQAAKNLMNAVVYAVKASYVASTKYRGRQRAIVHWRMRPPQKHSLVKNDDLFDGKHTSVWKGTEAKNVEPMRALSEFDSY